MFIETRLVIWSFAFLAGVQLGMWVGKEWF
jgi:hypothetical protein